MQEKSFADKSAKRTEEVRLAEEKDEADFNNFRKDVTGIRQVGDFKVTESEANQLFDYISKPVGPQGETQYDLDDSFESRMMHAYLKQSKFSKKSLERDVTSDKVRKIKKRLSNSNDTASGMKGQGVRRNGGDEKFNLPDFI